MLPPCRDFAGRLVPGDRNLRKARDQMKLTLMIAAIR
jgi:hypothetical protein